MPGEELPKSSQRAWQQEESQSYTERRNGHWNCVKTLEKMENTAACRFGTQCGLLIDDHWIYKIVCQGRNDGRESRLFSGYEAKIVPILEPFVIKPSTLSVEGRQESCLHAILPHESCLHTSIPHVRRVWSRCRSKTVRRITFNANETTRSGLQIQSMLGKANLLTKICTNPVINLCTCSTSKDICLSYLATPILCQCVPIRKTCKILSRCDQYEWLW